MSLPVSLPATGGQWTGWTSDVAGSPPPPPKEQGPQSQQATGGGPMRSSWSPSYQNPGRKAGYDSNILPGSPPGRRLDQRGRVVNTPNWPSGGFMSRPMGDRNYDVAAWEPTLREARVYSTVPSGGWARGQTARFMAPQFRPAKPPIMYDPTDPDTWDAARAYN